MAGLSIDGSGRWVNARVEEERRWEKSQAAPAVSRVRLALETDRLLVLHVAGHTEAGLFGSVVFGTAAEAFQILAKVLVFQGCYFALVATEPGLRLENAYESSFTPSVCVLPYGWAFSTDEITSPRAQARAICFHERC